MADFKSLTPLSDQATKFLDEALKTIPDGHRAALITYADTDGSVRAAFAGKLGDHWTIAETFEKERDRKPRGGFAVQLSW